MKIIQELKAQLAVTVTTRRREIPIQNQNTTNNQESSAKPSNKFGLFIPLVVISPIIGSLFTYFCLKRKKKSDKYE